MAPKRKAADEAPPAKRAKAEAKPEPKGRAKAKAEPEPKGRAKAAAKAEPEPKAKAKAKSSPARAKAAPRVSDADLEKELNTMIQAAKDGEFEEVFKLIEKYPPYVNERPEERKYSTIHQACYWGELDALKKLVEKYDADIFLTTKDGQTPIDVAKEHGHTKLVKYLEDEVNKKTPPPAPVAARSAAGDRNRVNATRSDGCDDADMDLTGVKNVTLKLGADGGGILCGAALVYSGKKKEKAVCYCDRNFKGAIKHSGDSYVGGKSTHTINIDLAKIPKAVDKVYLTLCSCGPANLQKYTNPSVELLGDDDSPMIRYDLTDAGESQSTIMAVLEKSAASWKASPVGAVCPAKFCGNYSAAEKLIAEAGSEPSTTEASASAKASRAAPKAVASSKGAASGAGYTEAELAKLEEKKALFAGWTNDKLKNLLKENDQSRTGNKAALVAKCAYGAAFGKLGRCPTCFGGKIKFRLPNAEGKLYSLTTLFGGATKEKEEEEAKEQTDDVKRRFYCTGYFDDDTKIECDWQADTVDHENWAGM